VIKRQFGFTQTRLPWTDEECCPGEHADGPDQPVSAAQAAADYLELAQKV